jgi:hypothetical protein
MEPQSSAPAPGTPLTGIPGPVTIPGRGKVAFGPFATEEYVRSIGRAYNPPTSYAKVDKERASWVAAEYDKMKHDPTDTAVGPVGSTAAHDMVNYRSPVARQQFLHTREGFVFGPRRFLHVEISPNLDHD